TQMRELWKACVRCTKALVYELAAPLRGDLDVRRRSAAPSLDVRGAMLYRTEPPSLSLVGHSPGAVAARSTARTPVGWSRRRRTIRSRCGTSRRGARWPRWTATP